MLRKSPYNLNTRLCIWLLTTVSQFQALSVCLPMQVYGAVAWSTDIASSGAGCLPGSGVVSQTLRAWSAAGAQGNWHLLPGPGALLWSSRDSSPHLAAAQCTKLVVLRTRTWEPSGLREFLSQLLKWSSLLLGVYSCFSHQEINLLFISGGDPKPWEGLV